MNTKPLVAAVALALGLGLASPVFADWAAAPKGVQPQVKAPLYDARSRSFRVQVQASNKGLEDLRGRFRLVIKDASLPVRNASGTTAQGHPFVTLSDSVAYELLRGHLSTAATVQFGLRSNPIADRRKLRYRIEIEHDATPFPTQLLHVADIDGKGPLEDVRAFSALVTFFRSEMPANTLTLSSGDNWIPGVVYNASADPRLDPLLGLANRGRAHVEFLNQMGFQASAMGNHDLDGGPSAFVTAFKSEGAWGGANFPYLSTNLNFTGEAVLKPLVTRNGQKANLIPGRLAGTATIEIDGRVFGIVGASTPKLNQITTVGGIGIRPADKESVDALAAEIQKGVDSLLALGVNKVILLAHMQQISVEEQLATRLHGVDIIVAGGSNTRLLDDTDLFYPGDATKGGTYPLTFSSATGEPVLVVNTDGDYKYLGRLILDFDGQGRVLPASLDPVINGAYATHPESLARLGLSEAADADAAVVALADKLQEIIDELASNAFGQSSVFLRGDRPFVRTEETNLGNLTADANLWYARQVDGSVQISLKNGGGIRSAIGSTSYPPGSTDPDDAVLVPPAGGLINQLDIQSALSFNNSLSLLTLSAQQLRDVIFHGIAASTPGSQQGRFPQIAGMRFSFTPPADGVPAVLHSLAVVDESGALIDRVVENGTLVGDPNRSFRMVTLGFLADGGDGYPFPTGAEVERVDLLDAPQIPDGGADFAAKGSEQDAFAEYLLARYNSVPFDRAETPPSEDFRIQDLSLRNDAVFDLPPAELGLTLASTLDLDAAEISAYDPVSHRLFVTDAEQARLQIVDLSDAANPVQIGIIDLSSVGASVTSVAVKNGILAAAVVADPKTDNGTLVLLDTNGAELNRVGVGALPDMVTFNHAGDLILVANEGELEGAVDPEGSISLVNIGGGAAAATVDTIGFGAFNDQADGLRAQGMRIFAGKELANDVEPEYISVSADDSTAYVSLQEANAIAVVDLAGSVVTQLLPLGRKDHSQPFNAFDASDRDGPSNGPAIDLRPWPVLGIYMPDGIASFSEGAETFVVTANEGDARADDGLNEEARVGSLSLDPGAFPDGASLKSNANLGRLTVSNVDGDTDGDGDLDELHLFGGRSFTLFRVDGGAATVAWDSEDALERLTAQVTPTFFNANDGLATRLDTRSDNKGPEAEGVTLATIEGRRYGFVVLERAAGGVVLYDLTNPYAPRFMDYAPGAPDGQVSAEQSVFIPAADHPGGQPLLVVSSESSGSIAVYRVETVE